MWIGFAHPLRQLTQHRHLVGGSLGRHLEFICNALDQPPHSEGQAVAAGEVSHLGAFQGVIEGGEEEICEHGASIASAPGR